MSQTRSTLGEYYAEHGFTAFGVCFLGIAAAGIAAEVSTALIAVSAVAGVASLATGLGSGNHEWLLYAVFGATALVLAGWYALGPTTSLPLSIAGLGAAGGALWRARQFYVAVQ